MPAPKNTTAYRMAAACFFAVLCALSLALADNQSSPPAAGACYAITFLSLKQGHHIGPAQLRLSDNGTMELLIADETITAQRGTFSIDGLVFTAATEFSAGQVRRHRYTVTFKGIALLGAYVVGAARLREYIDASRFIQEVPFLFAGSTESAGRAPEDSLLPF